MLGGDWGGVGSVCICVVSVGKRFGVSVKGGVDRLGVGGSVVSARRGVRVCPVWVAVAPVRGC